jgi:hypothetical protein
MIYMDGYEVGSLVQRKMCCRLLIDGWGWICGHMDRAVDMGYFSRGKGE